MTNLELILQIKSTQIKGTNIHKILKTLENKKENRNQ